MKQIIYAVEDDLALQELYTYSLENDFDCRCFSDGKAFFLALKEDIPDLVLLDIMLPGEDGFTILERLKTNEKISHIPVIMVSAKGEESSKVKGLNMGANDYISKPFGILEFIARIKANLPRTIDSERLVFKDVVIELSKHQIVINGNPVKATLKEYQLLEFLCNNPEKAQSRQTLFNEVWGVSFIGETRTLDIHIKELRKKLSKEKSMANIETIRGIGYMLI